ncbi:MAG: IS66 family insertion sequence element accessory protein TnpA [Wenzhouxiangella sp.]
MDMDQRREHWRGLIDQQARSGQSIRVWCEANGIKQGQYYSWKSRLRAPSPQATGKAGSFIPLELPSPGTLSIDFGRDIHVEVSGDCSLDHLRAALEVLRGSSRCWR